MIHCIALIIVAALVANASEIQEPESLNRTTADRIREYNYPVESHTVHTSDGYILTLFRIPYSPRLQNQNESLPVAFLHHGILSSSDGWILSGPDDALAYLLADAGYDVWMGNARGNTYSRKHETLSPMLSSFWNFNWHEIALYDVSGSIDYILDTTGESGLHYVGHSMGTTVFFVLMSMRPEYNAKIKTSHLLAPVAYSAYTTSYPIVLSIPIVGRPSFISHLLENMEFFPKPMRSRLQKTACSALSPLRPICSNSVTLIFGQYSSHYNTTLNADFFETHPAGTSINTFIHFVQERVSGHFRFYDHGLLRNLREYKQIMPPDYNVTNIIAPVRLYYSDNDYLSTVPDVEKIKGLLPNVVESIHVAYPDWSHLDFLFALEVKETINDRIINAANHFEDTGKQ